MHDNQDADEPGDDGDQTMPANPLPKEGTRERCHQERRQEEDGDVLVELKIFQGDEIERRRQDHEPGADELNHRLGRAQGRA